MSNLFVSSQTNYESSHVGTSRCDALLRLKQLKASIGLSRSTIYAMMDEESCQYDPDFPRQIKLGKSSVAWRESEVAEWLASRPRSK
jgi:prophage regulatory protein